MELSSLEISDKGWWIHWVRWPVYEMEWYVDVFESLFPPVAVVGSLSDVVQYVWHVEVATVVTLCAPEIIQILRTGFGLGTEDFRKPMEGSSDTQQLRFDV